MITEDEYRQAIKQKDEANKIIQAYHRERTDQFEKRMADGQVFFTDDELIYAATALCPCGHGLAYPKDCGVHHYWDCSAILKGIAKGVEHTARLPFAFYDLKSEQQDRGTTRGIFRPKREPKSETT